MGKGNRESGIMGKGHDTGQGSGWKMETDIDKKSDDSTC